MLKDNKFDKAENVDEVKGDLIENRVRVDFLSFEETEDYLEEKFEKTAEGYLKGRAIFTNIGVFPYRMEDGSVRWELRPPCEVFDYESQKSFKLLPLTNEHPKDIVNTENIKEVQVGHTGEEIRRGDYHLSISMMVTEENAIEDVSNGKRGLSAGYAVDLEMTSGVWMGVPYDAIQRNIRGNHIAIVDRGRAGDDAFMRFDSVDSVGVLQDSNLQAQNSIRRKDSMAMRKIRIDGVEYDADDKIIDLYQKATAELETVKADSKNKLDTAEKENTTISAENDQLKEENVKLKKDVEDIKASSPIDVEKAVQERMIILDSAKRTDIEVKADMSDEDIKKEVVCAIFPNSKDKLDSCDEVYLQARFDGALEKLDEMDEEGKTMKDKLSQDTIDKKTKEDKEDKKDSKSAYNRMVDRMQNASKTDKED